MDREAIDRIIGIGLADASAATQDKDGKTRLAVPYQLVPDGFAVKDLEHLLQLPTRYRRKPVFHGIDELIAYVGHHGSNMNSACSPT